MKESESEINRLQDQLDDEEDAKIALQKNLTAVQAQVGKKVNPPTLGYLLFVSYCRPVSSVCRALDSRAEGRGFKARSGQHSRSLNNWEEGAAFVPTSTNGWTF